MVLNIIDRRSGSDSQGNPIGVDGKYIVSQLGTSDLITDGDFLSPTRNVELPMLPANTDYIVGGNGRLVLIKRSAFLKNNRDHHEVTPDDSRAILKRALIDHSAVINDKPSTKPNYWVLVNINGKYAIVTIDSDPRKTHVEIVGWRWSNLTDVERIKKRAISEGGQVLITNTGAAGLSALQDNSNHKGSDYSETSKDSCHSH